jgi:FKBP-type peptidyl-prolyl cis-trans isomerase 2
MKKVLFHLALGLISCLSPMLLIADAAEDTASKEEAQVVAEGKRVSIEYTLTLANNEEVDSNVGEMPLTYEHGSGRLIPGLEKQLAGMKTGERKKVTVKPEDAYGPVRPEAQVEVAKKQLPEEAWKVGAAVQGQTPAGQPLFGKIVELREDKALVDFNHPLAGQTLYFDVKITDIN